MKKYFLVARNTWDEMLTYRLNFVMWRVRTVLSTLTFYFLWLAILSNNSNIFGYNKTLLLTYILGGSLLTALVTSSRSFAIGDEINQGTLSNYLIRPINYFGYWFAKDMGDKAMNIVFSLVEFTILFFLLQPDLFLQTNVLYLSLFLLSSCFAVILYFFLNVLLGFIGFWSPEVWAPRFILFMTLSFFSGGYFPLDILPKGLFTFFTLLPFSYLLYFPLKIYLGQLSLFEIFKGLSIDTLWVILFYFTTQFIWKKGLRLYTAQGR